MGSSRPGPRAVRRPTLMYEEFCQSKATAECQVATPCQTTMSSCVAARDAMCIQDAQKALASGTRMYTQPNAAECLSAVEQAYSQPPSAISADQLQQIDMLCEQVYAGTVQNNDSCKTNFDCATSGYVCSAQFGLTTTICVAEVDVPAGGFCDNPGSVCQAGYTCQEGASAATCQQPVGTGKTLANQGSACTTNADCAAAAPYCDLNVLPKGGTTGQGSCELGLFESIPLSAEDCNAFGTPAN